ncbi:hypothetical protein [Brevundimonas aurifodinae]|uniref:EF-hand domain-containing protein n=1 Tax=Brevundimonas aurifodinae TaxID=1508312 RepID=A0ABV1NL43_9CAUL
MSRLTLAATLCATLLAGPVMAQTAPASPSSAPQPPAPAQASAETSPAVAQALAQYDTDDDGKISLAEWTAAGRQERGFRRFDTNADGFMVEAELQAALEMMAQMRARQGQ